MGSHNLMTTSCGIFGYLIFMFMIFLILNTILRIPKDLAEVIGYYRQQNWPEFRVSLLAAGLFWAGSVFSVLFFYSAYTLPKGNYG